MRAAIPLLVGLAMFPATLNESRAQSATPIHAVTYVELLSASAKAGETLLTQYRDASRKEGGNMRVEVAREMARTNRFVVLEIWKDQAALDAHGKSTATTTFRDKLKGVQGAPYDERLHNAFNVGPADATGAKRAVIVVSHVDVPPPKKDDVIAALNPLADASRKGGGNQRFEVAQQSSRPNHFTVIEAWKDKKAYDASRAADPQKQFRDKLGPMLGALYDERLYQTLD